MAETLVPIRNALAETYMGDTKVVKDLFSSHETYDQRMVEILTGLGQHVDVRQPSAISTADIAECLRALNAENQVYRAALMAALSRSFYGKIPTSSISFFSNILDGIDRPAFSSYSDDSAYTGTFFAVSKALYSFSITARLSFDFLSIAGPNPSFADNAISFLVRFPLIVPALPVSTPSVRFPFIVSCRCFSADGLKESLFRIPFDCAVWFNSDEKMYLILSAASTDSAPAYRWQDLWYSTGDSLDPHAYGNVQLSFSFSFTENV